ncbi:MAG: hypothetical protein ACE5FF_01795 [Saprospiraceae bacterium]
MVKRIIGFILLGGLIVALVNKLSAGLFSFAGDKLVDIFVIVVLLLLLLLSIGKVLRS